MVPFLFLRRDPPIHSRRDPTCSFATFTLSGGSFGEPQLKLQYAHASRDEEERLGETMLDFRVAQSTPVLLQYHSETAIT